jgi:hypothetical protein
MGKCEPAGTSMNDRRAWELGRAGGRPAGAGARARGVLGAREIRRRGRGGTASFGRAGRGRGRAELGAEERKKAKNAKTERKAGQERGILVLSNNLNRSFLIVRSRFI